LASVKMTVAEETPADVFRLEDARRFEDEAAFRKERIRWPAIIRSPEERGVAAVTRLPLWTVPFLLPRSVRT
jgi:hypothetical protein